MALLQQHLAIQLTGPAEADTDGAVFVTIGDVAGQTANEAVAGDLVTTLVDVVAWTSQIIPAETWETGQTLYWQEAAQVVTTAPTGLCLGWAECPHAAGEEAGSVAVSRPKREPGTKTTFDFALQPEFGLQADHVLATFDVAQVFHSLCITHDGELAAGTAVVSIGDGTGANDQFLAAQDITTLIGATVPDAFVPTVVALPATTVSASTVVLRVATADITVGKLQIDLKVAAL